MSADFYAGFDDIKKLYKYIGSKMLVDKYQKDTLRIFKLASVIDVGMLCNIICPEWNINEKIIEYVNGEVKLWFSDIILQEHKKSFDNKI